MSKPATKVGADGGQGLASSEDHKAEPEEEKNSREKYEETLRQVHRVQRRHQVLSGAAAPAEPEAKEVTEKTDTAKEAIQRKPGRKND